MYYNNHDAKPATTGEKVLTLVIGLLFLDQFAVFSFTRHGNNDRL